MESVDSDKACDSGTVSVCPIYDNLPGVSVNQRDFHGFQEKEEKFIKSIHYAQNFSGEIVQRLMNVYHHGNCFPVSVETWAKGHLRT